MDFVLYETRSIESWNKINFFFKYNKKIIYAFYFKEFFHYRINKKTDKTTLI